MLNSPANSGAHDLFHAAKFYTSLNYGVIPVYGNAKPERPKAAAVDWKQYQSRRAGDVEFQRWFLQAGFGGLAIVTGSISRLVVLDFDDSQIAAEFAAAHPHLTETRTVQSATRHTPHYYFAVQHGLHVASRRVSCIDLLSDGCYVVAPPTTIAGSDYRLTRGGQPRLLNQADIDLMMRFLESYSVKNQPVIETAIDNPLDTISVISAPLRRHVDAKMLVALYQHHAPQIGRNDALFRQALYARDCGWSMDAAMEVLVDAHVHQPARGQHILETSLQRQQEAAATIESAFSRPPGKNFPDEKSAAGLPGTIREIFLKNNDLALLRVLDGLLMNHVRSGTMLTEKAVGEMLRDTVGRHSILKALQATMPDGQPVFEQVDPLPGTLTHTDVATSVTSLPEQKMLFVGVTEPDKKRGRPATWYRMPDTARLCAAWNVSYIAGDSLEPDDLRSVKKYRQGVHRELLKRRPGLYAREWLANRLGVTVRSMQRYRQDAAIQVSPVYREVPITWQTISYIPVGIPTKGVFLEDETGKRYPPLPEIARKLLKQKKKIRCMFQCENHYSVKESCQLSVVSCQPVKTAHNFQNRVAGAQHTAPGAVQQYQHAFSVKTNMPLITNKPVNEISETPTRITLPIAVSISPRYIPKAARHYRKPMLQTALEETANHLYAALKNLCNKASGYLSLPTARRLVEQYGVAPVKKALHVVKSRANIATPAGFVISWLRSEAKSWQNQYSGGYGIGMEKAL